MSTELVDRHEAPTPTFEVDVPTAVPPGLRRRAVNLANRFPSAWRGGVSLVDQGVVSATSFFTAIIINRACAPEEVGLYYLSLTIVLISLGVHEHIIAAPYTIYSRRYQGVERAAYAGSAWIHHGVVTLAAVALLLVAISVLMATGGSAILPALVALVAAGPLLLLREWIRRFAFADLDFATALAIDVCVACVQLGGLLALAYLDRLTLGAIFLVMGAACGLASLGWYLARTRRTIYDARRYLADWKHNWAFGRWAVRGYLVHNIVPYVMVWVVGAAAGTAAAGLLGACTTLIGVTTLLLTGVDRFLTPRAAQAFVEGGAHVLRRVLVQSALALLFALVPFALFVLATGSWLAELAYGEGFEHSGPILATLAFVSVTTAVGMVSGIGLWAVDRPRANFLADLCGVCTTIVLSLFLVPTQGALGAALATLAGSTVAAIVRMFTLQHVLSTQPRLAPNSDEASQCP